MIQGIGSIGGVIAGRLGSQGYDLTIITSNEKITEAINKNGITVIENGKQIKVEQKAMTSLDEVSDNSKFDCIFMIMKADALLKATRESLQYLKDGGFFVTCQNGIVEDDVAEIASDHQLVSAIIAWGGTMREPGVYEKTSPGITVIGELNNSITPRIQMLEEILHNVSEVKISTNIRGALWAKLGVNCAMTSLGALTGQSFGVMLKKKVVRDLLLQVYAEVVETAHAQGIKLESIGPNPYLLYKKPNANLLNSWFKDIIVRIAGWKFRNTKSSMLQSLERGKKSEIEYLNGYVVRTAEKSNLEVPVNKAIVEMINDIESKKLTISPTNIDGLLSRINE